MNGSGVLVTPVLTIAETQRRRRVADVVRCFAMGVIFEAPALRFTRTSEPPVRPRFAPSESGSEIIAELGYKSESYRVRRIEILEPRTLI